MESESLSRRLSHLSVEDKQRLLAHLLRERARNPQAGPGSPDPLAWVDDAHLDPSIQPLGPALYCINPRTVLLTGATGFLGTHLLKALSDNTDATIYCLIRAQNSNDARERLYTNMERYFTPAPDPRRVQILVGDLAEPNLGLTAEIYDTVAREADIIIHNGAHLHHIAPYTHLKGTNVDSTVTILRLATTAKPKWVHYVSTLVAAVDRDDAGSLLEKLPESHPAELAGGYAQSKWVSEKLLAEAVRRGIGATIFRPGFISGRSDNGAWPLENDHLLRMIKGCVQMGYASASNLVINMAPVEFVSLAIVRAALRSHPPGKVFNFSNPHLLSWEKLVEWLQGFGYRLKVVSNEVWREQHLQYLDEENALFPVLPLYLGGEITERHEALLSKMANVRNEGTRQMLSEMHTTFPVIDRSLWEQYVRYFQESGFLPLPH